METTLYFIRHGESEANERDAFLGHFDLPLTKKGHAQAKLTAEYLRNIKPDVIYSSDLSRAYQTCMHTAALHTAAVIKDTRLREIDAGLWDNLTFREIVHTYRKSYSVWLNDIGHARCDGGESVEQLQKRIIDAITEIAKKEAGKTVFIFTHATPIRLVAANALSKTLDELKTVPWATNASVSKFIFTGSSLKLVEYSVDEHLSSLITKLPTNV